MKISKIQQIIYISKAQDNNYQLSSAKENGQSEKLASKKKAQFAKESFSVGWILKLNYVVNQFKIRLFYIYSWSAADLNKVDFDAGALRRNSIWKTLEI